MASKTALYFSPKSLDDLKQVVQLAKKRKKCISVSAKKKTEEKENSSQFHINMEHFNKIVEINITNPSIVVEASAEVHLIKNYLDKVGLALCMPGLPDDKTIASAFSSGSHSCNMSQGILSSYVLSIDVLTSDNTIVTLTPEDKHFRAIACGLGACGIILLLTLKCEPVYQLKTIQFGCSFDKLIGNLPFNLKRFSNLSFSWWPHTNNAVVSHTEKINGAHQYTPSKIQHVTNLKNQTFDVVAIYVLNILYLSCLVFPFFIPIVHSLSFWLLFIWQKVHSFSANQTMLPTESFNNNLRTVEWFVPMRKTVAALKLIESWCKFNAHYFNYPMHIQFIKKDSACLSPANGCDVCCISVSINQPFGFYFPYEKTFKEFSELMKSIGGKPELHQNFTVKNEDLDAMFPTYEEWFTLQKEIDPHNLFVNYLE